MVIAPQSESVALLRSHATPRVNTWFVISLNKIVRFHPGGWLTVAHRPSAAVALCLVAGSSCSTTRTTLSHAVDWRGENVTAIKWVMWCWRWWWRVEGDGW